MRDPKRFEKDVPAGLERPEQTVGLTGLVPLEVVVLPEARLRLEPGVIRVHLEFAAGVELHPEPISYRVFGGEAGLDFERNGQIVQVDDPKLPLELHYRPRMFPLPPPRGQLALDLSFWYRQGGSLGIQDVQWRQPIVWDKKGGTLVELRFSMQR